jgi:hypothetical protein
MSGWYRPHHVQSIELCLGIDHVYLFLHLDIFLYKRHKESMLNREEICPQQDTQRTTRVVETNPTMPRPTCTPYTVTPKLTAVKLTTPLSYACYPAPTLPRQKMKIK